MAQGQKRYLGSVDNESFDSMSKAVYLIINKYIENNPGITLEEFKNATEEYRFPRQISENNPISFIKTQESYDRYPDYKIKYTNKLNILPYTEAEKATYEIIGNENLKLILFAVVVLISLEILLVASFYYKVVAKFEGSFTSLLYLSFVFAHKYIYLSLLFIILFALSLFLTIYVSFAFIFIIFGLVGYLESMILKYIWRNYKYEIPEV